MRHRLTRSAGLPIVITIAAIAAIVLPAPAAAQTRSVDETLEPVRSKYGLPALAAAVVKDGAIVAAGAVGVRVHGTDIKVTRDDRFHLGSDTKAMTATLAAMLVDDGKLRWDSTIGEVLGADVPGINPKLAAVTLEQLLSHTGGIPSDTAEIAALYFNVDAFDYNLRALRLRILDAWKKNAPQTPPGSAFHYANLGYIIAGAMIEKAADTPWEELIIGRIFAPLGLRTAGLGAQATMGKLDAPVGHKVDDKGAITPMLWGAAADAPPALGPAGIAHMSVLDFAVWAGWNAGLGKRGPPLVSADALARLHRPAIKTGPLPNARPGTPQEGEYALGWGVVKFDWSATPLLTHNGSNGMNLAVILVDVAQDLAVVVVTNFPEQKAVEAARELIERLYREFAGSENRPR
jgi:CubicO group peptidase (beta-lactamase class C family)